MTPQPRPGTPTDQAPAVERTADAFLRLGGTYRADEVRRAAELVAELARRINHATSDGGPYLPPDVDAIVVNLHLAVQRMPQALRQLARDVQVAADDPRLYVAGAGAADPLEVAEDAADRLRVAADRAAAAAEMLDGARQITARLRIRPDAEDADTEDAEGAEAEGGAR